MLLQASFKTQPVTLLCKSCELHRVQPSQQKDSWVQKRAGRGAAHTAVPGHAAEPAEDLAEHQRLQVKLVGWQAFLNMILAEHGVGSALQHPCSQERAAGYQACQQGSGQSCELNGQQRGGLMRA